MTQTSNFNLNIIDFDKIPWHEDMHENWYLIDAILGRFVAIANIKGIWQNATTVNVGDRYTDITTGALWTVTETHITASTGTFEEDRAGSASDKWELFSEVELSESWAVNLAGLVNSTDYSSKAYAVGTLVQQPNGSAKRWATEAEDTEVISGLYSALHYAAKTAADAIATAADVVSTNADVVSTSADAVSTAADVVSTNADAASTALDVIATAADAVATAADVVSCISYAAQAEAAANGFSSVTTLTTGTTNLETTDTRKYYKIDASGGTVTVNLPTISDNDGLWYRFEIVNADNTITIARDGTDYINSINGDFTTSFVGDIFDTISDDNTPDNWLLTFATRITVDDVTLTRSGVTFSIKNGGVDTTQLADGAVTPPKVEGAINAQTGTTYTLVLTDAFKTVTCSNGSAITLTVPTNASVAFTVGDRIDLAGIGAGLLTVTGDTGVTINGVSAGSATLTAQYSGVSLLKIDTDTWLLFGDHGGVV